MNASAVDPLQLRPPPEWARLSAALTEHSPCPMATLEGASQTVRYANPAFCRLLGRPLETLVGVAFSALLPVGDASAELLERVFRTGQPETFTQQEDAVPHPVFWAFTIWPIVSESLMGVMVEITETAEFHSKTLAMNQALLLSSLRQHEEAAAAGDVNVQLRLEMARRQRADDDLRVSEQRSRTLFESAPMAVVACDRSGVIQDFNRRAAELWGREPVRGVERLDGSVRLWQPDGEPLAHGDSPMREVLRTGEAVQNVEVQLERPDGARLPVLVNFAALRDAEGEITGAITSFVEITDRKRRESNLAFLAALSQELVRLTTPKEVMTVLAEKLGRYLVLSRCALAEIRPETDEAVVIQDWQAGGEKSLAGVYRVGDYLADEFWQAGKRGLSFVVRDTQTDPRTDAERYAALDVAAFVVVPLIEEGLWRFAVCLYDCAPRQWREDEIELVRELAARFWIRLQRAQAEEALRETKARLEFALNSAQVGDWDLDLVTDRATRSLRHDQAFGYRVPVEHWGFQKFIQHVHPADRAEVERRFLAAVEQQQDWHVDCRVIWPDASEHSLAVHGSIYRTPDGQPTRMLGIVYDITARRALENALLERAEALALADRNKNEFLAMLAHELRNPLAPLRNASEILGAPGANGDERAKAQLIVSRQIENMTRMIDDLLDVSRITEGKIELRHQVVALADVLSAAASVARAGMAVRGQDLAMTLPERPIFLDGDSTRLEQIFGNLLANACKYSEVGGHISLSAERGESVGGVSSEVIVRVRDDGMGIAPDLLPRIFDLFVQATRALDRAHGGLGIGLTLVQRLVGLHGGSVVPHSEGLGKGSEFVVRLPILPETTARPPRLGLAPTAAGPEPRLRILIVDDNEDSARSMATLQRLRGHVTRLAFTGPDAVQAAADFEPEVVLLDIGLPGMDGFEVARTLRSMPALAGAFLVAMSGYGSPEDLANASAAGFDEYLVKPADLDLLRRWLRER